MLEYLKEASNSILAYIAYIFIAIGVSYLILIKGKDKTNITKLKLLNEADRLKLLKREYNVFPKKGLTPEQYLEKKKNDHKLIVILALIIAGVMLVGALLHTITKSATEIDRKPNIVIEPTKTSDNPILAIKNEDSIQIFVGFENCGSAPAISLHKSFQFFICDNNKNPMYPTSHFTASTNSSEKILPRCLEEGIEDILDGELKKGSHHTLILCVTYCYLDSSGRRYGPCYRMFGWNRDNFSTTTLLPTEEDFQRYKSYLMDRDLWHTSFF